MKNPISKSAILLFLAVWIAIPSAILRAQEKPPVLAVAKETEAGGPGLTWWLPEDVSMHGYRVDSLFYIILWITGIIFVVVEGLLFFFVWKFRARPNRKAVFVHGHKGLEITWTIATAFLLFGIVFLTKQSWSAIKMTNPPENARHIGLQAQQFTWKFTLVGSGDQYGKTGDVAPPERQIHLEVKVPAAVHTRSIDVIHSFFIPQMRVKQDIVPGINGQLWFTPNKIGRYEIVCAELCGAEHSTMRGVIHVDSPEDYQKWVQSELAFLQDKPK